MFGEIATRLGGIPGKVIMQFLAGHSLGLVIDADSQGTLVLLGRPEALAAAELRIKGD